MNTKPMKRKVGTPPPPHLVAAVEAERAERQRRYEAQMDAKRLATQSVAEDTDELETIPVISLASRYGRKRQIRQRNYRR